MIHDRRAIPDDQLLPVLTSAVKPAGKSTLIQTDLSHYFWLILVLVFAMERWLAHKNKPVLKNG